MTATTYRMLGRPAGAPFTVLLDHRVGDVFTANLDPEVHRTLIACRALEEVPQAEAPSTKALKAAEPKQDTPEAEIIEFASGDRTAGAEGEDATVESAAPVVDVPRRRGR